MSQPALVGGVKKKKKTLSIDKNHQRTHRPANKKSLGWTTDVDISNACPELSKVDSSERLFGSWHLMHIVLVLQVGCVLLVSLWPSMFELQNCFFSCGFGLVVPESNYRLTSQAAPLFYRRSDVEVPTAPLVPMPMMAYPLPMPAMMPAVRVLDNPTAR